MSKFYCGECVKGIHRHESGQCEETWTDSKCDCTSEKIVLCSLCRKREATVMQSEFMRKYATYDRINEDWVYRIRNNIPDLCQPCDHRLWSS